MFFFRDHDGNQLMIVRPSSDYPVRGPGPDPPGAGVSRAVAPAAVPPPFPSPMAFALVDDGAGARPRPHRDDAGLPRRARSAARTPPCLELAAGTDRITRYAGTISQLLRTALPDGRPGRPG